MHVHRGPVTAQSASDTAESITTPPASATSEHFHPPQGSPAFREWAQSESVTAHANSALLMLRMLTTPAGREGLVPDPDAPPAKLEEIVVDIIAAVERRLVAISLSGDDTPLDPAQLEIPAP